MRKLFPAVLGIWALLGATAPAPVLAECGNSVVESGEDCDNGGLCVDSPNTGATCATNADCPGGTCRPYGGDGCATNCTFEMDVPFELVPGVAQGETLQPGTSGAVAQATLLGLPIPLTGQLALTVGKERNGQIPVVIRNQTIQIPGVEVLGLACGCVRGASASTCGGTFKDPDGSLSLDCTDDPDICTEEGRKPCALVHGPGNTASGVIGCDGLDGVNLEYVLDLGGDDGPIQEPEITLSGTGPAGSAALLTTIGIDVVLGQCRGSGADYGPDRIFCTEDDQPSLGASATNPAVTGRARSSLVNLPFGDEMPPVEFQGRPFSCSEIARGNAGGAAVVSAFAIPELEVLGSLAAGVSLVAKPSAAPICTGDCSGDGEVTVNEIITMVNIALGSAELGACGAGDANADGEITVNEIVAAVNKALAGC